jgi:hypothetical protein
LIFSNNLCAGHPSSRCLQYLQANRLLIKALPENPSRKSNTIRNKINQLKCITKTTIPTNIGMIETKKSGTTSFQIVLF